MLDVKTRPLDSVIKCELRASHAGEFGAVWIYRGALAANRIRNDRSISEFASRHLNTERAHLLGFEQNIEYFRGSILLGIWWFAGFVTGAIPTLLGRNWFFYTIYCVESFVDKHYHSQIKMLGTDDHPLTVMMLDAIKSYHQDEQSHRDEAVHAVTKPPTTSMKIWGWLIEKGSEAAVALSRVI
jgi:ubiquinone biosynthesis monooxygenase Coq7